MRISIVTPTLNRARFLPQAIESARGAEVEHIIVDGMSTDETPAVLARYPHLRVIREPDTGLYDALNKGLRAATGGVVGHLNSDDCYTPGALDLVAQAFADERVEAVSGGAEILGEGGEVKHRFVSAEEIAFDFRNVTTGALIPNARFFRRTFAEKIGLYDTSYRVAADRDWMFRAALAQPRRVEITQVLYRYLWHEDSLTFSGDPSREARWREEYLRLAESYLNRADLPAEARECMRRWHLRESAQAATRDLLGGKLAAAWKDARRGSAQNDAWAWMFLRHLGGALLGR